MGKKGKYKRLKVDYLIFKPGDRFITQVVMCPQIGTNIAVDMLDSACCNMCSHCEGVGWIEVWCSWEMNDG